MAENFVLNSKSELVKMLIDNTPIAYIIMNRNYDIYYINESFATLRNLDMNAVMGDKCYNISNGGKPCVNCAVAQSLATGEKAFISRKDVLPNGSIKFIDDYAIPLQKNSNGEVEFILEIMINRTPEMLAKEQRNTDYDEILAILASLIEAKDTYTATHSENVRRLSLNLAKTLALPPDDIFEISVAASLHDIGKINIPNAIINKAGALTKQEFDKIKLHPVDSYNILDSLISFDKIREIALRHHERMDGRGYPDGLTGDQIPIGAKIVAVADTYDSITTTRSYRKALSHEYALEEIQRVAGTQLDPAIVDAFLKMDFGNLTYNLYDTLSTSSHQVERIIEQYAPNYDDKMQTKDIHFNFDQEKLINEIFEHTPCGYVLIDHTYRVVYASDYFLNYMGLSHENVMNRACYLASGMGSVPCESCPIKKAMISKKTEYIRQEQKTPNGVKIFDLYGVPLTDKNGNCNYFIEIIIDRTKEAMFENARRNDFEKIIELLVKIFEDYTNEIDKEKLSNQISSWRTRLDNLLSKTPI